MEVGRIVGYSRRLRTIDDLPKERLFGQHFPSLLHSRSYCQWERLWAGRQSQKTKYYCAKCGVTLCAAPCFEAFHTFVAREEDQD